MPPFVVVMLILFSIESIIGFIMMGMDKKKAEEHKWRISEKSLFLIAFIGGSAGVLLGMWFYHHKTRHIRFLIGIPLILLIQAAGLGYLFILL